LEQLADALRLVSSLSSRSSLGGKSIMAQLLNTRRCGVNPVKGGGGAVKMRDITVEIFTRVSAVYKKKEFLEGSIALMMSTAQTTSRLEFDNDNTMKIFGGMIARNEASRPHYLQALDALVTESCAYGYESPQSAENLTAWAVEHVHDGGVAEMSIPGTWALHCCGKTTADLLRILSEGVFDLAIARDGWTSTPGSFVLKKNVTIPGKGSWMEGMKITIAPRGELKTADVDLLRQMVEKYKFLSFDTRMCYCEGEGSWNGCASAALADDAVAARDRAAVLEFHGVSSAGIAGKSVPWEFEAGGGSAMRRNDASTALAALAPAPSTSDGGQAARGRVEPLRADALGVTPGEGRGAVANAAVAAATSVIDAAAMVPARSAEHDGSLKPDSRGVANRLNESLRRAFHEAAFEMERAYAAAKPGLITAHAFQKLQGLKDNMDALKAFEVPAEGDLICSMEDPSRFEALMRSILLAAKQMSREVSLPALKALVHFAAACQYTQEMVTAATEVGVELPFVSDNEMKVSIGEEMDVKMRDLRGAVAALKASVKQAIAGEAWSAAASLQDELEQAEAVYAAASKRQRTGY
jgi:hypothetical protein